MNTITPTSVHDSYTAPPRGGRYQYVLLAVLSATFGFVFFDRMALNVLVPFFKQELGLDAAQIGLVAGLPSLTWAVSGILIGYISDRADRRKPLLIAAVIGFTICSVASGLVGGVASLLLVRALMGATEGAVLPLIQPMVAYSSQTEHRGRNMGVIQGPATGLLGGVLSPIVTVWLAQLFGWRGAFFFTVIPGVVLALLCLRYVKELRLKHHTALPHDDAPAAGHHSARGILSVLRERNIVICLVIGLFYMSWFALTQIFTPLYLTAVKGLAPAELGITLSSIGIAWIVWGYLIPAVSDRIGRKTAMIVFTIPAILAPLAVMYVSGAPALFFALILTYTGMGCMTMFMAIIPAETVSARLVGSALGLIMGTSEIVGGFVVPVIAGSLSDRFGLAPTMLIASGAAAAALVMSFFLKETAPSKVKRDTFAAELEVAGTTAGQAAGGDAA